ncbi:hypothetical protein [Streptococcus sp. A34]|uniref:hypothetical protein n=1 Tax=Streptococcus sp. A34 TaxID=3373130 RepID=UPI00137B605E
MGATLGTCSHSKLHPPAFFVQFSRLAMDFLDWGDPVYFLSIWTTIFLVKGNL